MWRINVDAPLALTQLLVPVLEASAGILMTISSDAAVEHYETLGPTPSLARRPRTI